MRPFPTQPVLNWPEFAVMMGVLGLVFTIAGCYSRAGTANKGEKKGEAKPKVICSRIKRNQLVGISEQVGCLLEAAFPGSKSWNAPPGEIIITAYSLNNLVPLWNVRLVGKYLVSWPSSVSRDGSYLAAKLITHKGPLLEDPYYAHLVFFDLKGGKVAWIWPEKPVPLDPHDWLSNFSPVYFATDQNAYWSTRKDNQVVLYKLNIPGRKAEPVLTEGEDAIKFLQGPFYLEGYSPATEELLVSAGKVLYAVKLGPQRAGRVLLDELPMRNRRVYVSRNGTTIAVLGDRALSLLHEPPDFKVRCRLDVSKLRGLGSPFCSVACSPDGQYIALCYFDAVMLPARFVLLNLSGDSLLEFNTAPLGDFCNPIVWFDDGNKIAAAIYSTGISGADAWCIWELHGLK